MTRRRRYDPLNPIPFAPPSTCLIDGDGAASSGANGAANGAGGDSGAGANGSTDTQTTPNAHAAPAQQPDWNGFLTGLEQLNNTTNGRFDELISTVREATTPPPAEPGPPPDFDAMGNSELAAHIVGTVTKQIEQMLAERLTPLTQMIQTTQQTVASTTIGSQIKELQAAHKDFGDWKTEMVALAKEHPTLDVPSLYRLARANSPAKAGDLDKRYAPPAVPRPLPFGGLTPLSAGRPGAPPVMSAAEAGRAAYREVAERHPGVLSALENL